jgi:hypothetical protein
MREQACKVMVLIMRREHFRIAVGSAVIVVHAICYAIIIFAKSDWFTVAQQIDLGLLFLPITSAYLVAVVRSAIEEQASTKKSTKVNLNYSIIISLLTFFTLIGLIVTVVQLKGDIDLARRQILLFEIAFGTAFGLIASDLFGKVEIVEVPKGRR